MRKILFITGLVLLSGCSSIQTIINNDTTKDPTKETKKKKLKEVTYACQGQEDSSMTLIAKGDQLLSMKQVSYLSFSDMGIEISDEMNKDTIQQKVNEALDDKYKYIDGVDVNGNLMSDKVEITIQLDFEKADLDELVDNGLLDQAEKENGKVSLKKTMEAYQESGYACQEQ